MKLTKDDITISKIEAGSAIISGALSAFTADQSDKIASGLTDPSLTGAIIEGNFSVVMVQATQVKPTTTDEETSSSLGLILGIVIPLCLISKYIIKYSNNWYNNNYCKSCKKKR